MALDSYFTHYDLHTDNVLLYEPIKNGYITYNYYISFNGKTTRVTFNSRYIVKIIDYGRCFYDLNTEDEISDSSKLHQIICSVDSCKPKCGSKFGFLYLTNHGNLAKQFYVLSSKANSSHDLRLLSMLKPYLDYVEKLDLRSLIQKVVFKDDYGTPDLETKGYPKKINNVTDACLCLKDLINKKSYIDANNNIYSSLKKIGEMHIHNDGSPLRFEASP